MARREHWRVPRESVQPQRRKQRGAEWLSDVPNRIVQLGQSWRESSREGSNSSKENNVTLQIRVIIRPFLIKRPRESKIHINEIEVEISVAKAKEVLAAPHKAREVDDRDLEAVSRSVRKALEEASPEKLELFERVADAVIKDSSSAEKLRTLMAESEKYRDAANRVAEQIGERDPSGESLTIFFVLAAACLLGGGVTIPLVLGAKAELIYTNVITTTSLVCAGAALAKGQEHRLLSSRHGPVRPVPRSLSSTCNRMTPFIGDGSTDRSLSSQAAPNRAICRVECEETDGIPCAQNRRYRHPSRV
jgi:hypothetical protein